MDSSLAPYTKQPVMLVSASAPSDLRERIVTNRIATPANAVTVTRIALSPLLLVAIWQWAPAWWLVIAGFCAMFTDGIDGWLARRYGISKLGIFLDPLADKIMVLGSFFVLGAKGWMPWVPIALMVAREVVMSLYRSHLARRNAYVVTRRLAKLKTWIQSWAIAFVLMPGVVEHYRWFTDSVAWAATALTLFTFAQYLRDGSRAVRQAPR